DVPSHDNSPPLDVSKDQIEDFSESNKEFSSNDDDSLSTDDIDYVEASPPDSELVSLEELEENLVTYFPDFWNSSEPSNARTNVVNAPREPYVFKQDNGNVLRYGEACKRCTCKSCGKDAHIGYNCPSKVLVISNPKPCNNQTIDEFPQALSIFHPTFHSEDESPFTLDSIPTYVDESPNVFNPPPQPS
nr:hypothetical protein [Tanacetum cinerariifolium]